MIVAECFNSGSCEKLEILSGDSIDDKLKWSGWTVNPEGRPICPRCSKLSLSDAVKMAGFKSAVEVAGLSSVSRPKLYIDYEDRFRPLKRPVFYNHLRKAMDAKHMQERAVMEAAIIEIMKKEVEND